MELYCVIEDKYKNSMIIHYTKFISSIYRMHEFHQIDDVKDTITIVHLFDTIASVTSLLIIIFIVTHGAFRWICKFYTHSNTTDLFSLHLTMNNIDNIDLFSRQLLQIQFKLIV